MRSTIAAATILALLFLTTAQADVAPFGVRIGVATLEEVRSVVGSKTRLTDVGINKWSDGPMLRAQGSELGIEGLQRATFIFDPGNKLVGVLLSLPNTRFDSIKSSLQEKYKLVDEKIPFVGNKSARFRDGPVSIEVKAPHLSFDMEVNYIHAELQAKFDQASQAEQAQQKKTQTDSL
ncbi:hypothetical protein [Peristeroidobacter soli]|uniref:hypothetical protein n=1 Tax=Peristeroidobacter soli TaxID=2497877 RepID=UPI00101C2F6D|nr:hypothetical protein [Peristeroidobacter soli]